MGKVGKFLFLYFLISIILFPILANDEELVRIATQEVFDNFDIQPEIDININNKTNYVLISITYNEMEEDFSILLPSESNKIKETVKSALEYDIKKFIDTDKLHISYVLPSELIISNNNIQDNQTVKIGSCFSLGNKKGMALVRNIDENKIVLDRIWAENVYPYMPVFSSRSFINTTVYSSLERIFFRLNPYLHFYPFSVFVEAGFSYINLVPEIKVGLNYLIPLSLFDNYLKFLEDARISTSLAFGIRKNIATVDFITSLELKYEQFIKSPFHFGIGISTTLDSNNVRKIEPIFSLGWIF